MRERSESEPRAYVSKKGARERDFRGQKTKENSSGQGESKRTKERQNETQCQREKERVSCKRQQGAAE